MNSQLSTVNSQLKNGYKQTEVGVIPEDWNARKLGDLASFRTGPFGSALHKSDYTNDGVPVINPMHINDGQIAPSRSMTVTESAAAGLSEFRLKPNEVIIGRRGDMGRCAVVQPEHIGWLCGTGSMIVRPSLSVDAEFLQRILSSPSVIAAIEETSVGSTMINLNQATLSGLVIQTPPLPEQRAIATALSDVDALLAAQDKLIAKKRDIKQAAMQQLLTGKQRLPGFSGAWEVKRLGDVADIDSDNLGSDTPSDFTFNYISLEDVDIGSLRSYSEQVFSSAPSRARRRLKAGDILVSTVRPNLQSHLLFTSTQTNWVCSTGFSVVRCKIQDAVSGYVFSHIFANGVTNQIEALLTGSNYPAINGGDVRKLEIPLPSIEEQTAIAAVLSDMDADLAALEQQRDKTRALKQGMMQELLTGRIRLV